MSEDLFDEIMREISEALRRMKRMQEEIEYYITGGHFFEDLYEERMKSFSSTTDEPLVEIRDVGDEVLVIVDIAGVREETLDVRIGEDTIEIMGVADERKYREAFTGWHIHVRKKEFHGAYKLPYKINPETVRVERRGSLLVIRAKKATSPQHR